MEIGREELRMSLWKQMTFNLLPEIDEVVCIQITEQGEMGCYCTLLDYPQSDYKV